MRMMLRVKMDPEKGNAAIADGSVRNALDAMFEQLRPEAAYFHPMNGTRGMTMVFDMADPSDIPPIVEPLFMGMNAEVELVPCMNRDDLMAGLQKFRP